jgi:RNA polymerase sigma-70 factor (ECF subfamily)
MHDTDLSARLEEHHTAGFCWALACCGRDAAEAEEVLQSVYLKVLEGKARFRGESSFRTWLFALIRLTAADRRRRRAVRALFALRLAERVDPAARVEHPDDAVLRLEARHLFLRSLGRLAARQREVLELVFYHEMSVEEAASVMRVTTGAARQHYERGKRRLREVLEESEVSYVADWRGREAPGEIS